MLEKREPRKSESLAKRGAHRGFKKGGATLGDITQLPSSFIRDTLRRTPVRKIKPRNPAKKPIIGTNQDGWKTRKEKRGKGSTALLA